MALWFEPSPTADTEIRTRFGTAVETAARAGLQSRPLTPRSALALVILLDQFPRNIWRGSAQAFANDAHALAVARQAVAAGFMPRLAPIEQPFLTLPFQHSESPDAQRESVRMCGEVVASAPPEWQPLLKSFHAYAQKHFDLIARFGRFPHRNLVLGREPTDEERVYMASGAETFGQG